MHPKTSWINPYDVNQQMLKRAKDFGLDDLDVNISVIPNRVYKFDNQSMN